VSERGVEDAGSSDLYHLCRGLKIPSSIHKMDMTWKRQARNDRASEDGRGHTMSESLGAYLIPALSVFCHTSFVVTIDSVCFMWLQILVSLQLAHSIVFKAYRPAISHTAIENLSSSDVQVLP
jgi:hypothetical protein